METEKQSNKAVIKHEMTGITESAPPHSRPPPEDAKRYARTRRTQRQGLERERGGRERDSESAREGPEKDDEDL